MRIDTIVLMLISLTSLGAVHFFEKMAIQSGAPPAPFALGQTAIALLALWPVWLWRQQQPAHASILRSGRVGSLMLIGILASGVVVLLSIAALVHTSATHKGVVQAAYPLGTMLFAWWLLRERITAVGYVAAGAIVSGLVLMTSRGFSGAPNLGDWMLIATVPMIGFADAYSKKVLADLAPIAVTLGRYLFGTAFLVLVLLAVGMQSLRDLLPVWPMLLAAGLLSALAMGFFYWSVRRKGPSIAAGMLAAAPIITATLEWWWLGERFAGAQLTGIAMVIAGVATLSRQHASRRPDE